ncbi:MAG: flagellar biosynthesis protein FlhB [Spirochaetales bacterium]|nr:flagellar biosynthesis protein FlhB [Spirochaetales bacterium]
MPDILYALSARLAWVCFGTPHRRFYISLNWFAPEDEGRTEDPTEYKIRKAREEGKVAKSQDLTASIILLFGVIALAISGNFLFRTMAEMMEFFFNRAGDINLTENSLVFDVFMRYFVRLMLPVGGIVFVAAFLGNVLQVGFLFSAKPITPDLQKIIPKFGNFFKRAFASGEAAFNLLKSIVKIAIIGVIAYMNISSRINHFASMTQYPILESFKLVTGTGFAIMAEAAVVMLAFAIFDYIFQRRKHLNTLKMSKQEVKEERKTQEGDPLIKSRLRERMRQVLNQNMLRKVPEADVVVTNPTHFAVAMEWDRLKMHAPTVTAKGQDNMAFRIRDIARQNDVPVIENKPLARALYADVDIGDIIPEKYYEVVALVLVEVYSVNSRKEAIV